MAVDQAIIDHVQSISDICQDYDIGEPAFRAFESLYFSPSVERFNYLCAEYDTHPDAAAKLRAIIL